jgi:hypothetical protein
VAKKQITDRSSSADRAQAASELRQAINEFWAWFENAKVDPNTPRDVFEGVDYGPMITSSDIDRQKQIIAQKYDYVEFGNISQPGTSSTDAGLSLEVGADTLFVPGFGEDPDTLSSSFKPAPEISFNDDAGIPPLSGNSQAGLVPGQFDPAATEQRFPTDRNDVQSFDASGGESFSSDSIGFPSIDRVSDTPRGSEFTSGTGISRPNATGSSPVSFPGTGSNNGLVSTPNLVGVNDGDPRGRNQIPTTVGSFSNDDNVSIGTSGFADSAVVGTNGTSTEVNTDEGQTVDTGRSDGELSSRFDQKGTTPASNISDSDTVKVGVLGQSDLPVGTGLYEINPADLAIRPNVLHNYVNWTYNVSMYMLDTDTFGSITANGGVTNPAAELKNLLIRSGGTGRKGILGEKKDYHIDNFRFTSIVGQNSQGAKSSNNFDISFDIYEPYGVAFLAELVQLAYSKGIEDHFEVPYLMEVKFNGYDSSGNPVPNIPGSGPKYIPIKIIDIKFSITSAATVYHIRAVPYAHIPLQDQHDAFIRDSISLTGETFDDLIISLRKHMNQAEQNKAKEEQRHADTYEFLISDNDLRNSKVGFTHLTQGQVVDVARQGMTGETNEAVQINANSTIKSAIQAIANATDFGAKYNTTGQPESNHGNENLPYRLIKVIPVVTNLGPYNTSTMRYRKTVTFKIETQKMYGFIAPGMPSAGAQTRGWQKEYNWIFTGKNQDIIDFQADYNIQYYQIRNSFVDQKGKVTGTVSNPSQSLGFSNLSRTEGGGFTFNPAVRTTSQPVTDQIYNSYRGAGHQQASDNMDNVLNNPGADMIVVNLQIIGDPDWIPQDRSVLPKGIGVSGTARIVGGSIAVDSHDTFIMLKFRTPRDYNPESGLMQIDTEQTFVQGLYRVITLESVFEGGRFMQNLKMIRVQNQVSNDASNIPSLTTFDENDTSVRLPNNIDPGRSTDTENQTSKIDNSKVKVNPPQADDDFDGVNVPVGTVSSARPAGPAGNQPLIRAGDETNALDALAETNNLFNGN